MREMDRIVGMFLLLAAALGGASACYSPRSTPAGAPAVTSARNDGGADRPAGDGPLATSDGPGSTTFAPITDIDSSCKEASSTCAGNTQRTCTADGMVTMTVCPLGCNPLVGKCNVCTPNLRSCTAQGSLETCKPDGSGTEISPCQDGCDVMAGECKGCAPSALWCNGTTLRECDTAGQPGDKAQCPGGCNAAARACNKCKPAERSCNGDSLVSCSQDGSMETTTACEFGCNAVRLECNKCKPSSLTCEQNTQLTCRSDGSGVDRKPCATLCNPVNGECNDCVASSVWCNGNTLRECTVAGAQLDKEQCPSGCNEGRKACNACEAGSKRCEPGKLVSCKGDGSGVTEQGCGAAGCNQTRLACNVCEPNARQCLDATTLRTCAADGASSSDKRCALGCDAAAKDCRSNCPAGQIECGGACLPCDKPANGRAGCVAGTCKITGCDTGYYLCEQGGLRCVADGVRCGDQCGNRFKLCGDTCIGDDRCCTSNREGCPAAACESNSAATYECQSGTCRKTARPCGSPTCSGGTLMTPSCSQGQCSTARTECNFGCANATSCQQSCGAGTFPSGGQCVRCGGANEPCCPNSTSQCDAVCGSRATRRCGADGKWDIDCPPKRECCKATDCSNGVCNTCSSDGRCVAADVGCSGQCEECRTGACVNKDIACGSLKCSNSGGVGQTTAAGQCVNRACVTPTPSRCEGGFPCASATECARSCPDGQVMFEGRCQDCGREGQPCCQYPYPNAPGTYGDCTQRDTRCYFIRCVPCGDHGQPCCATGNRAGSQACRPTDGRCDDATCCSAAINTNCG